MQRHILMILGLVIAMPATAVPQDPRFGARVRLQLADAGSLSGELLAARHDTLWILPDDGRMHAISLAAVQRARVPQGGFTSGTALTWTLVGGVVTGLLLAHACSQVADGCAGVVPITMIPWIAVGGVSAVLSGSSSRDVDVQALAPYARFPQGLPQGFVPSLPGRK